MHSERLLGSFSPVCGFLPLALLAFPVVALSQSWGEAAIAATTISLQIRPKIFTNIVAGNQTGLTPFTRGAGVCVASNDERFPYQIALSTTGKHIELLDAVRYADKVGAASCVPLETNQLAAESGGKSILLFIPAA